MGFAKLFLQTLVALTRLKLDYKASKKTFEISCLNLFLALLTYSSSPLWDLLLLLFSTHFFFIIQRVKACAIPYPHQPPTRDDNTVSVAQSASATTGTTKQLSPPDRVLKELYIYIYIYIYARSINSRDYIKLSSSFLVCSL